MCIDHYIISNLISGVIFLQDYTCIDSVKILPKFQNVDVMKYVDETTKVDDQNLKIEDFSLNIEGFLPNEFANSECFSSDEEEKDKTQLRYKQDTKKFSRNSSNSKLNKSNLSFKKSESSAVSVEEDNKTFVDQKKKEFAAIITYSSENSDIKTMRQLKVYLYEQIEEKHKRFCQINSEIQSYHLLLKQK